MKTWWVNQNKTFRQEFGGGYLWSPMKKRDGSRNQFYENMMIVRPGDLVFSYAGGQVCAWGVALSSAYNAPKPKEFGGAGGAWDADGYKVDVEFRRLARPLSPKAHMELLAPLLPGRYAPL